MTRPGCRTDDGVTLIELLVTLTILGIGFVAVLAGLATSSASSDQLRNAAGADTVLRSFAEHVKGAAYTSCARAAEAYDQPLDHYPGFTTDVTVSSWDPEAGKQPCRSPDRGLQLVEVSVRTAGAADTRAVVVQLLLVKRDPDRAP